jgi:hypothetical protein
VFPPKSGGEIALFVGVIDGHFGFEGDFTGEPEGTPDFRHEEDFGGAFEDVFPGGLCFYRGVHGVNDLSLVMDVLLFGMSLSF